MDILIIFYSESNWPTYIWLLAEVPRLEKQMALLIHRCACRLHSSIIGLHYFNWPMQSLPLVGKKPSFFKSAKFNSNARCFNCSMHQTNTVLSNARRHLRNTWIAVATTAKIHTCPNVSNQLLHAPSQRPTDDLRALPTLPSARPSLSSTLLRSSLAPYKENEKMTTNYANDAENLSNNQRTDPDS